MSKVLLIVIDALSARHVDYALKAGKLPAFQALIDRGKFCPECISIFPSITPAATASIITGEYPDRHGVPGAFYYNTKEDRVYYFGDDTWPILREGLSKFFNDLVVRLNRDYLQADTLFEIVERSGLSAASLNYLVFRGLHKHDIDVPWLMRLWPGVPWVDSVLGPSLFCLGDLARNDKSPGSEQSPELDAKGGVFRRFGLQDENTGQLLRQLIEQKRLHDLTVAYFPDNDFESHAKGPGTALAAVENVDRLLSEAFDEAGGIDALLQETAVLITGDHSQCDLIADEDARGIDINGCLTDFAVADAGKPWEDCNELMVCPNMRAASIYLRRGGWTSLERIVTALLADYRIDQVIWRPEHQDDPPHYHVATADRGKLEFWKAEEGFSRGRDRRGNHWQWQGELDAVSGQCSPEGELTFDEYPNAFERIAHAFIRPAGGDMWITASVGHEFELPSTSVHNAGSHGSLHALDSTAPLIIAGAPASLRLPEVLRTVDLADLCLQILGLK